MSKFAACNATGLRNRALAPLLFAFLFLAGQTTALAAWHHQQRDLMGTRISVDLWHEQAAVASECGSQVFTEMRRIEALMSTYKSTSEITFINENAITTAVEISAEMMHLIKKSIDVSEISRGAFDITYASVGYAYNYRKREKPSDESLSEKLPAIDYHHIMIEGNKIQI